MIPRRSSIVLTFLLAIVGLATTACSSGSSGASGSSGSSDSTNESAAAAAVSSVEAEVSASATSPARPPSSPLRVVTGHYPLAFVASRVGEGLVDVRDLTPRGVDAHDLELTPDQANDVERADLVIMIGDGFQPSVERAAAKRNGATIEVLETIEVRDGESAKADAKHANESADHADDSAKPADGSAHAEDSKRNESEDDHAHEGGMDPHIWLDPVAMTEVANETQKALTQIDPQNTDQYARNADALRGELETLDAEFRSALSRCRTRVFVTSHDAFDRLAARYELTAEGIAGIDPASEPSADRLAEIADLVKKTKTSTIFTEVAVSSAIAETVARETGAKTAVLDSLESAPDGSYFDAMRTNLSLLRAALACS